MKKIAVFSDIHGNYQALESIINDINKDKFDDIICLGDLIAGGPSSVLCLDTVMNSNIKMVLGNHELYQVKELDDSMTDNEKNHAVWIGSLLNEEHKSYLKKCPLSLDILTDGHLLTFVHFLSDEDNNDMFLDVKIIKDNDIDNILVNSNYDYLFFGYEHKMFDVHIDNRFFSCIGSSGCTPSNITFYTVIEVEEDVIKAAKRLLTYDRKSFEKLIKENDYPSRNNIAKIFFGIDLG